MDERRIEQRRAICRFFAQHARAPLPKDVGATADDFVALERAHAVVLDPDGRIAFSNPFAAAPTDFTVESDTVRWSAICAWDALGILAATRRSGSVRTRCPDCDAYLTLEVADGHLRTSRAVAHFLVPAAGWYEDLRFT